MVSFIFGLLGTVKDGKPVKGQKEGGLLGFLFPNLFNRRE